MRLRGQIIGKLKLKANEESRQWTPEEISLAEATIERAALAIENARLLEDAQRRAAREQAIGEISTRIGTFTDIEAILRSTVNEVGQKIGGARVVFELGTEEDKPRRES
jgi:GAF domain-containing protein